MLGPAEGGTIVGVNEVLTTQFRDLTPPRTGESHSLHTVINALLLGGGDGHREGFGVGGDPIRHNDQARDELLGAGVQALGFGQDLRSHARGLGHGLHEFVLGLAPGFGVSFYDAFGRLERHRIGGDAVVGAWDLG